MLLVPAALVLHLFKGAFTHFALLHKMIKRYLGRAVKIIVDAVTPTLLTNSSVPARLISPAIKRHQRRAWLNL